MKAYFAKLVFLVFMSFLVLVITPASAATPDQTSSQSTMVKAGIYLIDANKFDIVTGSYVMDFYLLLSCKPNCNKVNIELMNGDPLSMELQESTPATRFYRIKAALSEDMNLRNFPFDDQSLSIFLEDKLLNKNKLIFEPDIANTKLDPSLSVVGWTTPTWKAKVRDYYYAPLNETFSRYIFTVRIHRPFLSGIVKSILPAIIILIAGFLTLVMAPGKVVQRLGVATTALVAMVVLHLAQTASIPSLGYMTFIDAFMLINYLGLLAVLIQTVILMRLVDLHKTHKAHGLYVQFRYFTPLVWLLLQLITMFIFYL